MSNFANPFNDSNGFNYLFEDFSYLNKVLGYNRYNYNSEKNTYELVAKTTYDYNNSISLSTDKFERANVTITVFPNTTTDFITIQNLPNSNGNKIIITDISGKIVLQQNQKSTQLDVQNLAKGIYVLQVFSGEIRQQNKFLKE